jgi:hypothetical protein
VGHNVPQGTYGSNYLDRDVAAITGYLEQTADQALYPIPINKDLMLTTSQSYIYTFSSRLSLASSGFWSLTLYDSQGFLVANLVNKYSVGDRTNITSDGQLVHGSNDAGGDAN